MIKNITRNKVLVNKTKIANSSFEKMLGLMFKPRVNYGLIFNFNIENNHGIHTCFMRFPIDVLFLNSKKQITKTYKNVKPWRMNIFGKAKYVIELLSGKSRNTQIGDKISFK